MFSKVATTSAASKGLPSLNLTPWRSVKVHTSPFLLGVHLVASLGTKALVVETSIRYSEI